MLQRLPMVTHTRDELILATRNLAMAAGLRGAVSSRLPAVTIIGCVVKPLGATLRKNPSYLNSQLEHVDPRLGSGLPTDSMNSPIYESSSQ